MDKIALSYHDAAVYESDCLILKSKNEWLNDRIISFYFEYLSKEVYDDSRILFIGPEVTQAIKLMKDSPSDAKEIFLDPLDVSNKSFIIFAVNDNSSDVVGGSHWSLGVYSKSEETFFHFDSLSGSNSRSFSQLVNIFQICLDKKTATLTSVPCLQQNNTYACGDFVLCHADLVCQTILKSKDGKLAGVKKLQPKKVSMKRNEVLQIIENLKDEN